MPTPEEVQRALNEEKIARDRAQREENEASKARIREQIAEKQRREGK